MTLYSRRGYFRDKTGPLCPSKKGVKTHFNDSADCETSNHTTKERMSIFLSIYSFHSRIQKQKLIILHFILQNLRRLEWVFSGFTLQIIL